MYVSNLFLASTTVAVPGLVLKFPGFGFVDNVTSVFVALDKASCGDLWLLTVGWSSANPRSWLTHTRRQQSRESNPKADRGATSRRYWPLPSWVKEMGGRTG